jgi:hypothetical protein
LIFRSFLLSLFIFWSSSLAFSAPEMILYRGEKLDPNQVQLGGWGSGVALETQREFFTGSHSIEIRTDGYYSGGRIDFLQPVDITDALAEPNCYLVFTLRFRNLPEAYAYGSDVLGAQPAFPGFPGYGGSPYSPFGLVPGEGTAPMTGFLRVILVVNGKKLIAEDQPVDPRRTENGWTTVAIPLKAFSGPKIEGRALLSRILIFGDRQDTMYLGELRTVVDDEEITVDPLEDQVVSVGEPVELTAVASGGLATLEFVWDWDASDGIQEEAYGEIPQPRKVYRKSGEYVVTLRVRDLNRVKPEAVVQTTIQVVD